MNIRSSFCVELTVLTVGLFLSVQLPVSASEYFDPTLFNPETSEDCEEHQEDWQERINYLQEQYDRCHERENELFEQASSQEGIGGWMSYEGGLRLGATQTPCGVVWGMFRRCDEFEEEVNCAEKRMYRSLSECREAVSEILEEKRREKAEAAAQARRRERLKIAEAQQAEQREAYFERSQRRHEEIASLRPRFVEASGRFDAVVQDSKSTSARLASSLKQVDVRLEGVSGPDTGAGLDQFDLAYLNPSTADIGISWMSREALSQLGFKPLSIPFGFVDRLRVAHRQTLAELDFAIRNVETIDPSILDQTHNRFVRTVFDPQAFLSDVLAIPRSFIVSEVEKSIGPITAQTALQVHTKGRPMIRLAGETALWAWANHQIVELMVDGAKTWMVLPDASEQV